MDTLVDRIKEGMSTETDARVVDLLIRRLSAYEKVLRHIAVYGTSEPAMLATHALVDPSYAFTPEDRHGHDDA